MLDRPAGVTFRVSFTAEGLHQFRRDNLLRAVGTDGWSRFYGTLTLGPTMYEGRLLMTVAQL